MLVAVRKRAFLAASGCALGGEVLIAMTGLICPSKAGNAGLSTAATAASHRRGRSLRWITRGSRMVSARFLTAGKQRYLVAGNKSPSTLQTDSNWRRSLRLSKKKLGKQSCPCISTTKIRLARCAFRAHYRPARRDLAALRPGSISASQRTSCQVSSVIRHAPTRGELKFGDWLAFAVASSILLLDEAKMMILKLLNYRLPRQI